MFLQFAKHWIIKLSGHRSICHMTSPHVIYIFFNPPSKTLNNILCELHGSQWTCKLSTLLGWHGGMDTHRWKKLTRSNLSELTFTLGNQSMLHLVELNALESMLWMKIQRHNLQWIPQPWHDPPTCGPYSIMVHYYQNHGHMDCLASNIVNIM